MMTECWPSICSTAYLVTFHPGMTWSMTLQENSTWCKTKITMFKERTKRCKNFTFTEMPASKNGWLWISCIKLTNVFKWENRVCTQNNMFRHYHHIWFYVRFTYWHALDGKFIVKWWVCCEMNCTKLSTTSTIPLFPLIKLEAKPNSIALTIILVSITNGTGLTFQRGWRGIMKWLYVPQNWHFNFNF